MTPRFSSFLVEELIPEVAKSYNLSKDPNDRGIAGSSTGGVGAFVAAWNRPDQFRRVITLIGSFGNFRGADRLPGLIRKTEPKPIRVVMQTGRQDINNYAGSWYLENPRMVAALEFAGYDVKLELGEEGHNARHGAAVMPDMLRWLWRDYPAPIVVKDPRARRRPRCICAISSRGATSFQLRRIRRGRVAAPRAHRARYGGRRRAARRDPHAHFVTTKAGSRSATNINLWQVRPSTRTGMSFSPILRRNRIYKSDAARTVTVFKENTGGARALRVGADGRHLRQPARQAT